MVSLLVGVIVRFLRVPYACHSVTRILTPSSLPPALGETGTSELQVHSWAPSGGCWGDAVTRALPTQCGALSESRREAEPEGKCFLPDFLQPAST